MKYHRDFDIAAIAQLGERQTEDLKVPGSIPGRGIFNWTFQSAEFLLNFIYHVHLQGGKLKRSMKYAQVSVHNNDESNLIFRHLKNDWQGVKLKLSSSTKIVLRWPSG